MTACLFVDRFESATIVLPVMNETVSLEETVAIILRDVKDRTKEILIVVCEPNDAGIDGHSGPAATRASAA